MKKIKSKSLRGMVLGALCDLDLPYTSRNAVAKHVAKKLGGHYVKTKAGWERLPAKPLPTPEFLGNQAQLLTSYAESLNIAAPQYARLLRCVAKALETRASMIDAGEVK